MPSISEALPQRGSSEAIARGKAAIARARDVYANLKTYQDQFTVEKIQIYSNYNGVSKTEGRRVCERPGKFSVTFTRTPNWGECSMVSDGQKYWRSVNQSEVYAEGKLPDFGAAQVFQSDIVAENLPADFYPLMRTIELPPMLFLTPREVVDSREEPLEGRPGLRVICTAVSENDWEKPDATADIVVEMWFDAQTGTLSEMVRDSTIHTVAEQKAANDVPTPDAPPRVAKRIATVTRTRDVRVNQAVDAQAFVFKPERSWRQVSEFRTGSGADFGQYETAGLPAPAFKLKNLDGKEVSLSDFAGRVVLLDFWATWCGPCVAAMPHLQKLQEEFKDQPVSIVGINSETGMSDEKLKDWLEKRKFTFGQLREGADGLVMQAYHVAGIPHTVLIDQRGVLQDVTVGYSGEKHGEILAERIKTLLAGKSLKSEQEFKDLRVKGEKQEPANVFYVQAPGEQIPVTEMDPGRLIGVSKVARGAAPWSARSVQMPDGRLVFMTSGGMGGAAMTYFGAGENDFHSAVLEDVGSRWVSTWDAMVDLGKLRFLCFVSSPANQGMAQKNCEFFCHDENGKKLWSSTLDLPEMCAGEIKIASGDLDGDGRPEVAVLVRVDESDGTRGPRRSGKTLGKLCVFSADGKLLVTKQLELENNVNVAIIRDPVDLRNTIVALGGGRVWRFKLDGSPSSLKQQEVKPNQSAVTSP